LVTEILKNYIPEHAEPLSEEQYFLVPDDVTEIEIHNV
jgi:hypothetical protein